MIGFSVNGISSIIPWIVLCFIDQLVKSPQYNGQLGTITHFKFVEGKDCVVAQSALAPLPSVKVGWLTYNILRQHPHLT